MNSPAELNNLTESLERKLVLLRELAEELATCRPAFMTMDLDGIYLHITKQTAICEQLRITDEAIDATWKTATAILGLPSIDGDLRAWMGKIGAEKTNRFRQVLTEFAVAEGEVRHQNRLHITLVDGSRRTLNVLGNALAAFSPTYALPRGLQAIVADKALS